MGLFTKKKKPSEEEMLDIPPPPPLEGMPRAGQQDFADFPPMEDFKAPELPQDPKGMTFNPPDISAPNTQLDDSHLDFPPTEALSQPEPKMMRKSFSDMFTPPSKEMWTPPQPKEAWNPMQAPPMRQDWAQPPKETWGMPPTATMPQVMPQSMPRMATKPLFVEIGKYRDVLRELNLIKKNLKESDDEIKELVEDIDDEERTFAKLNRGLQDIEEKLSDLEKCLFVQE